MRFHLLALLAAGAAGDNTFALHATADCSDDQTAVSFSGEFCDGSGTSYIGVQCDGTVGKYIFSTSSDCSGATSECQAITGDLTTIPSFENCYFGGESGTCDTMTDIDMMGTKMASAIKIVCDSGSDPCFSRETEACRVLDTSASPADAFRACFDEPSLKEAERVPMASLAGGDYVLTAGKDLAYKISRVLVNQHRANAEKRATVVKITHATGELSLTPDHVLLVDGEWAPARSVKVGSSLAGSAVLTVTQAVAGIINPVTASGMIVAAGPTGRPVVASAYPEWIAEYMLEQNNGVYPLPVSMANGLAYLFPATAQAFWDEVLEAAFAANQPLLRELKFGLPAVLVAPAIFVVDLLCAASFALFALGPKALAALAAVGVAARVRRAKA